MRKHLFHIIILFCISLNLGADQRSETGLGRVLPKDYYPARSSVIWPDGGNLPPGSGDSVQGAAIFAEHCVKCHGAGGRGGFGGELAGGKRELTASDPDKTIGSYWPYATTLFDFIRRAMPLDRPWSLTDDEVYAVVAYLLWRNELLGRNSRLDAATLATVKMPNRLGFDGIDAQWSMPAAP